MSQRARLDAVIVTHRELDGGWTVCPDPSDCQLRFHFQDQTPEQLATVPEALLYPLLEIVDPPTYVGEDGDKLWCNAQGQTHRDYDLPAKIYPDGMLRWSQEGRCHRGGQRPAIVYPEGWREWWVDGVCMVVQEQPDGPYAVNDGTGAHPPLRKTREFPVGLL